MSKMLDGRLSVIAGLIGLVAILSVTSGQSCGGIYKNVTGTLSSPNAPGDVYGDNLDCTYIIDTLLAFTYTVTVNTFALENKLDFLYYGIGTDSSDIKDAKYLTGDKDNNPDTILFDGREIWFRLITDGSDGSDGFSISYIATVNNECNTPQEINSTAENITSPFWPDVYPDQVDCTYIVKTNAVALALIFDSFDIRSDDYLQIKDGDTILRLSGSTPPKDFISSGKEIEVAFHSEGSSNTTGSGFRMHVEDRMEGIPVPKENVQQKTLLYGSLLRLTSSNYPNKYPDVHKQVFQVSSSSNLPIVIDILDVDLEDLYDFLTINDSDGTLLTQLTGNQMVMVPYVTSDSSVTITFTSDYSGSGRGFALTLQEFSGVVEEKDMPSDPPPVTVVNYTYSVSSSGVEITSPGYPDSYPNNVHYTWLFTGIPEQRLSVDFLDFGLEYFYDVLVVGTGGDPMDLSSRYAIFTGSNLPEGIVLDSETAWIQLRTDSSNSSKGFRLNVNTTSDCINEYTLAEGEEYYLNYATNKGYCQWVIRAARGKHIQLSFSSLYYVTLEFGTGSNPANALSRSRVLTEYDYGSYSTSSDTVWLAGTFAYSGSLIAFISDDGCVIESVFESQGVITSPGYPFYYSNDADCIWIIQTTGEYNVRLKFNDFLTEKFYDRLIIGGVNDGPDRDYLELSGSSVPDDVVSNLNGLSIRFRSDGTFTERGFNISYSTIYNCPDGYTPGNDGETCYKFVTEAKSWQEARRDCLQTPNSDLVVIKDDVEATYIQRSMNEENRDWWIGLSDQQEEGSWAWVNCEYVPAGNLSWAVYEPTNTTSQNCVFFNMDGHYSDENCTRAFPYICKEEDKGFDRDEQQPLSFTAVSEIPNRIDLSWEPSPYDCDVSGYQLVGLSNGSTIHDETYDPFETSVKLGNLTADTEYTFYLITMTYAEGALENSLMLSTNTVAELECPAGYQLNLLNNKCYKVDPTRKTWVEARQTCVATPGADLVIIDSEEMNDLVGDLSHASNETWFGLYDWNADYIWSQVNTCRLPTYDNFDSNDTHLEPYCALKMDSGVWVGKPCSYQSGFVCEYFLRDLNKTSANPNFVRANLLEPTTVQMYWTPSIRLCDVVGYVVNSTKVGEMSTSVYVDGALSNAKVFYDLDELAEYEFTVVAETVTFGALEPDVVRTVLTGVECPGGYQVGYSNNCFKFAKEQATWDEARNMCADDGGYLVIINNMNELAYVRNTTLGGNWWIGFNDQVSEGSWYWSECSSPSAWQESNWAPGQPSNFNNSEHCGQMLENGQWNDWNCKRTMQYICEIPRAGVDKLEQNPSGLTGYTVTYNRVHLQWTLATKRCDIIGYTITYTGSGVGQYFVEGGDQNETMIPSLEPNSTYTFRINAVAFYGDLPIVMNDSIALTTTVKLEGSCPYDYEKVNGVCYKFVKELVTWSDAQKSCMEDDAVLVIINDQTEKSMLMNRTGGGDCWIGLNDQVEEGSFFWGDCTNVSAWQSQQWGDDEPNDANGDQDCVVMMGSGVWSDQTCDQTNQYICEVVDIGYDPVDINPSDFAGVISSAFSVTLTWKPSPHNCEVVEYRILYTDRSIQTVVIPGKNSNTAEIEGLRSNTEYSFRISAFTALGNVEYSDPVVLTTRNFTSEDCSDGTPLTDSTGNITSPNFPVEYPPNADCVYVVALPDVNTRVRMRFATFDLVDRGDYIEITDLNTGGSDPYMLTLTGTEPPKDYISMTNSVQIRFVSGSLYHGSGFQIVYEEELEALPVAKDCQKTYTLKPGGPLRIQSTDYPNSYPNYVDTTWTLKASESMYVIAVNFFDIDFESGYDYLSFDDALQTIVTGDTVPVSVISESDTLIFRMSTDYSVTGRGFSLAAEEIDPSLVKEKNVTLSNLQVRQAACGGTVNISTGSQTISSPLYPASYENNANCLWKIVGSENNGIVVDFQAFDVEYGYDYVFVGYGYDESDATSIIAKFSGPNIPSEMVVEGGAAWIQFVSDSSTTGAGFQIEVSSKTSCGEDLMIPDGSSVQVKSVNSPYNNNEYCLYTISSRRGSYVRFELEMLDIEEGYDFLSFGTGQDPMDSSSRLFSLTGAASMKSFYTKSNELWILFTSDATNTGDGYIINVYDDACGISSLFGSSGQLVSPSYPLSYPNTADCVWIIQVAGSFRVELTFTAFDLEMGRDFLVVGGITQNPLEDQEIMLTGNQLPETIVSASNGLNLQFISDSSTSAGGFDLTWQAVYSCPEGYNIGNDNVTCYKFGTDPKSWLDARADCLSTPGGDLIVVNDKTENDYLVAVAGGDDLWIGFYDKSVEKEWFWVDCLASTEWGESNWAPGQPDNGNDVTNENCAKILQSTGQYDDEDCTTPVKYVCEHYERLYDYVENPSRLQGVSTTPTSITLSWRIPNQYCDVLGYTVRYNGTNGDVVESFSGSQTDTAIIDNLASDTSYIFEIASNTSSFGTLPYEESITVKTIKSVDELCPDGWVVGPYFTCYNFSTIPRTWADARNDCLSIEDGDLVIINDAEEHAYIQNMTGMQNTWWIGFYDQATEESWRWVDCSISSVWQRSLWASGQPDDSDGLSDCGQMNAAGEWEDEPCSKLNNYICERRKKPFVPDDANPSLFRGQVLNPVSVSFTWRPSRYNCDVTGYKIRYQDGVQPKEVEVSGSETSAAVIRDLTPATIYVFSIAATTLLGDLSYGQFRTLRTLNESDVLCPAGYEIGYDYNCFKFSVLPRTWNGAREDCQSSPNSDLAKLDTPEDLNYVLNVRNASMDYWIGYYDVGVEKKWQWIDCTDPSNFTAHNWGPGEPSDIIGNQDCGELQSNGNFYDQDCTQYMLYICKVIIKDFKPEDFNPRFFTAVSLSPYIALLTWKTTDILCDITGYMIRYNSTDSDVRVENVTGAISNTAIITNLLPSTTYMFEIAAVLTTGPLPYEAVAHATTDIEDLCANKYGDWETGFNGTCYRFSSSSELEYWTDARIECQKVPNGDLALIQTQLESEYIKSRADVTSYWIGYLDKALENDWHWLDCTPPSSWASSYWLVGQPDDIDSTQNCGYLDYNKFQEGFGDAYCGTYMQFICEISDKGFEPDDANPSRFRGSAIDPNTVEFTWRISDVVCDIVGYKIIYFDPWLTMYNVLDAYIDTAQITGLKDDTEYTFSIAAFNELKVLTYDSSTTVTTPSLEATTKKPVETTLVDPRKIGGTMITLVEESDKSFDKEKQLKLAETLADQANEFCSASFTACLAPRNSVYKSDNIEYYSIEEVNANMEVEFWISDPGNTKVAAMTTEQADDMLSKNQEDSEFEYVIGPVIPEATSSLELWAIILISLFALCMLVIILGAVINCNNKSRKNSISDGKSDIHEMAVAEDGNSKNGTTERCSSNVYFEVATTGATNSGFKPDTVPDTSIAGASKPTGGHDQPTDRPDDNATEAHDSAL